MILLTAGSRADVVPVPVLLVAALGKAGWTPQTFIDEVAVSAAWDERAIAWGPGYRRIIAALDGQDLRVLVRLNVHSCWVSPPGEVAIHGVAVPATITATGPLPARNVIGHELIDDSMTVHQIATTDAGVRIGIDMPSIAIVPGRRARDGPPVATPRVTSVARRCSAGPARPAGDDMTKSRKTLPATVPGYRIGDQTPEVAWRVPERHPSEPGPWSHEADKVAWRDRKTGLDCIVRREATGHLGGYVGVGESHPLFGWQADAIPAALEIEVHGGVTYAEACDETGPPEISICHVDHDAPAGEASMWWFGFEANQPYDLVPSRMRDGAAASALVHGVQPEYRGQSYMYGQILDVARQLAAIARGEEKPPRVSAAPPPLGLDPDAARVRQ